MKTTKEKFKLECNTRKDSDTVLEGWIDGFEIWPCTVINDGETDEVVEQCDETEASFWGVYAHYKGGGLECLMDCEDKATAQRMRFMLKEVAVMYNKSGLPMDI